MAKLIKHELNILTRIIKPVKAFVSRATRRCDIKVHSRWMYDLAAHIVKMFLALAYLHTCSAINYTRLVDER